MALPGAARQLIKLLPIAFVPGGHESFYFAMLCGFFLPLFNTFFLTDWMHRLVRRFDRISRRPSSADFSPLPYGQSLTRRYSKTTVTPHLLLLSVSNTLRVQSFSNRIASMLAKAGTALRKILAYRGRRTKSRELKGGWTATNAFSRQAQTYSWLEVTGEFRVAA